MLRNTKLTTATIGWGFSILLLLFTALPHASAAATVKCNKKQTICELEAHDLVIGDKIAFFNEDKQVLAEGKVVKIEGDTRKIKITTKYGKIRNSSTYRIINKGRDRDKPDTYAIYKHHFSDQVGASVGLVSLSFGNGGFGTEFSGFWAKKIQNKWPLLIRGAYMIAGADVPHEKTKTAVTTTASISGLGVIAGGAAVVWPYNKLGFRFEGGLGGFLAQVTVEDGDPGDYNTKFSDGVGLWLRTSAGVIYDPGRWQYMLEAVPMHIHGVPGLGISLSVGHAL